jgi:pentatricopeptide repeat protein
MLRRLGAILPTRVVCRNIYIASQAKRRSVKRPNVLPDADPEAKIKQIQAYTAALRRYISEKDEQEVKRRAAQQEQIQVIKSLDQDLDILDDFVSQDSIPAKPDYRHGLFAPSSFGLPPSLLNQIGNETMNLIPRSPRDEIWNTVVKSLHEGKGLKGIPGEDINTLIKCIPLNQRAPLMTIIYEMLDDAGISPNKMTLDLTMAAYAHKGQTTVVQSFMDQIVASGYTPDVYSYGHLIKCLGKNSNIRAISKTLAEMRTQGVQPSLEIYTITLQTCIRVKDYDEAFKIFDMLKYMSTETLPDVRIYNSMLLAAAKQHNVEKVLDLLREMTCRPIKPLEPDTETYNTLIFACARDKRAHIRAWQFLLEMQEKGFSIDRKAIGALMYLCGESGEIVLSRAMFKQLCSNPVSYPDSFMLNSLMKAYSNFSPGMFSPIMATEMGAKIRSSFFLDDSLPENEAMPPLLPVTMLHSKEQLLAESQAIISFFKDVRPELVNDKVLLSYLTVAYNLGSFEEFVSRFESETYFDKQVIRTPSSPWTLDHQVGEEDPWRKRVLEDTPEKPENSLVVEDELAHHPLAVPRNWLTYDLAIRACSLSRDIDYANKIWMERGMWRRTDQFKSLPNKLRTHADFQFAQHMVALLARCGEIDQALRIIKSTIRQFTWKRYHVEELSNKVQELEDETSIKELGHLLRANRLPGV